MGQYDELIALLNHKGFHARFFEDAASAKDEVLKLLSGVKSVGIGGSMTLNETGIFDAVINSGKTIYSHALERQKENPDVKSVWRGALLADAYLTSTNALTQQGDLINIDGNGNRAAAMFFGPDKVIVVCGVNKITKGPHDAIARIKKDACPKNAQRLGLETPCALKGKCEECSMEQRMCNVTVRIQYPPKDKEIHILLINENLGY